MLILTMDSHYLIFRLQNISYYDGCSTLFLRNIISGSIYRAFFSKDFFLGGSCNLLTFNSFRVRKCIYVPASGIRFEKIRIGRLEAGFLHGIYL